jgi:arginase
MTIALLSAPTNLGLRPPAPSATPGCAKAPEALRAAGLYRRLGGEDAGLVVCPRYLDDAAPDRLRNQEAILDYSRRLADRLSILLGDGRAPLLLGGDCSLLLGVGLAMRRAGRYGLVHIDGHTDFRHPGNSAHCASLAGEDLAAAVGLHWPNVSLLGGARHFDPTDVVHAGCRADDEHLAEARATLAAVLPAAELRADLDAAVTRIRDVVTRAELDGYWLHLDLDVLDESILPAVDSPASGGLSADELVALLRALAADAVGAHAGIYDPDLDPDGSYARLVADVLADGLNQLGSRG